MDQRTEGIRNEQTADERRHAADRRRSSAGLRPGQVDRRRSDRRHIAGAGLLAALALAACATSSSGCIRRTRPRTSPGTC